MNYYCRQCKGYVLVRKKGRYTVCDCCGSARVFPVGSDLVLKQIKARIK